jgi:hypothetical protein
MCFAGELFPNDRIPADKWNRVLINLMVSSALYIIFKDLGFCRGDFLTTCAVVANGLFRSDQAIVFA